MRFLTDENIFPQVVTFLRKADHDVKDIQESGLYQITDDKIIEIGIDEKRTIITFDKHFGDILRYPPQDSSGIILIRIHPPLLEHIFDALNLKTAVGRFTRQAIFCFYLISHLHRHSPIR